MKLLKILAVLVLLAATFASGYVLRASKRGASAATDRRVLYYVDPMHPAYTSDKPGDCPICGMRLIPLSEAVPAAAHAHEEMPAGSVQITPEKQQFIGVKIGVAEVTSGAETIHAQGKVAYDETSIGHIHSRVEGWIDKVFVDFTGKRIEKGQPLLTIYSPEMLASQRELLIAAKAQDIFTGNELHNATLHAKTMLEASRRRLELWQFTPEQIERVLTTGVPIQTYTLHSPLSGVVTERKAFPNQKAQPEMELYTVVDLSRVWIVADLFEYEASAIQPGVAGTVNLSYQQGRSFPARVTFVQPDVDPATRTIKVRLEASNANGLLKPEMFVTVDFKIASPPQVTVPAEAVLDGGIRKTVYVDRGNGYFEPRAVETGERRNDRVAVLRGLKPGERIAVSGTFLLDSESQMRAAAAGAAHHD